MQEPKNLLAPNAGLMTGTILVVLSVVVLLAAVSLYFFVRGRRARDRHSSPVSAHSARLGSLAALESEVVQLRTDVAQLELAQDFTTQLLLHPSGKLNTADRSGRLEAAPDPELNVPKTPRRGTAT